MAKDMGVTALVVGTGRQGTILGSPSCRAVMEADLKGKAILRKVMHRRDLPTPSMEAIPPMQLPTHSGKCRPPRA